MPGLADEEFIRGEVPLSKQEVRMVTLGKARVAEDSVVIDVGAGTGGLTVEAALVARRGRVYAVERSERALSVLAQNIQKFALANVTVVPGEAPEILQDLPASDVILVGGSGGRLAEILALCRDKLVAGGSLVINAVTIETLHNSIKILQQWGWPVDCCGLTVNRLSAAGRVHMFQGLNPVYIIKGTKE